MRRIIITFIICGVFFTTFKAQTTSQNYIIENLLLDSLGNDKTVSVTYFNGLGHEVEKVSTSAYGQSIYTVDGYDAKGRQRIKFLPFPYGTRQDFINEETAAGISASFYNDDSAFRIYEYDSSDNATSITVPGLPWARSGKADRASLATNTTGDKVLHYEAPLDKVCLLKPSQTEFTLYPAGTLTKETATDADGKSICVFRDMQGNTVMERREKGDTYFVYNIAGQLRYVLSPMYQNSGYKDLYAYEYRYDDRGNVVKKILPGCEYTQYWYDGDNKLTFMQDCTLRKCGMYRFFTYDRMGRLAVQGVCKRCDRNIKFKRTHMSFSECQEGLCGTGYVWGGRGECVGVSEATVEKVVYYDKYNFVNRFPEDFKKEIRESDNGFAAGRMLGSVTLASDGQYLYNAYFYDTPGNLVRQWNKRLDGYSGTLTNSYTFTGNVESTDIYANVKYGDAFHAVSRYEYSRSNGKLIKTVSSVSHGAETESASVEFMYDAIDRTSRIMRPDNAGDISYNYDIHGWVNSIESCSFKERLHYADGCGEPCYNGNVSSMTWENGNYPQTRGYKFSYDRLNRLTLAEYGEREELNDKRNRFGEKIEYDINGNIKRLQRRGLKQNGVYGKIDNLHVYLNGNQIKYVEDDADKILYTGALDFNTAENGISEYKYDGNGNLTSDTGRGITKIDYDIWNNPERIQFSNGNVTKYVFSADGEKLKTVYYTAMPNISVPTGETHELSDGETLSKDSTEYLAGACLTINNGRIDKFLFNGGFFKNLYTAESCTIKPPYPGGQDGNQPTKEQIEEYEKLMEQWKKANNADTFTTLFFNKDHLGNNREVVNKEGRVLQVTNYYPFGAPFCDGIADKGTDIQQYKFSGKELDMTHGLNTYDFGARQMYPAMPVWDRMDKMAECYYWTTPYAFCGNNPVRSIDPDGKKVIIVYQQYGTEYGYIMTGRWDDIFRAPRNQFVHDVISAHSYLKSHRASEMFDKMILSNKNVYVKQTYGSSSPDYDNKFAYLFWDSHSGLEVGKNKYQSPATQLEHEFTHIVDYYENAHNHRVRSETLDYQYENKEERRVITGHEKEITKKLGESRRYNHLGKLYRTKDPTSIQEYEPPKETNKITNHIDYDKIINNSLNNKTDNLRVTRIW